MSVFEDLIAELKNENLIEPDVTETTRSASEIEEPPRLTDENSLSAEDDRAAEPPTQKTATRFFASDEAVEIEPPIDENEFYRRRAIEEVAALQLVEQILSGVEREQMKIVTEPFDDIAVSKALHEFLQISKNFNSPDNAVAEFKLMQETENWYSVLSFRDRNILPAHLRRYCETTRPALSSQALAALARFYRNSPYSEAVRSKFEMVITRLFSQETGGDEREMVFDYNQIVEHLAELYADWSSVSLYSTDNDDELSAISRQFEDFINEADSVTEFEELVGGDFFNRLRAFKEETGENFYAPPIAATAIECNVQVGNIYVELLDKERCKNNTANLENKYSHLLDNTISEATSKTMRLTNLLEEKNSPPVEADPMPTAADEAAAADKSTKEGAPPQLGEQKKTLFTGALAVNRWLVGATILIIALNVGFYSWIWLTEPQAVTAGVENFQLEGYYFRDYVKTAGITDETLIGFVNPSWNDISEEKKREVLKNILAVGKEKGFKAVRLQEEGKTIGYADQNNITTANSNRGSK